MCFPFVFPYADKTSAYEFVAVSDYEAIQSYGEVFSVYADTVKMTILWGSPYGKTKLPSADIHLPSFEMISPYAEVISPYAENVSAYRGNVSPYTEMVFPYADMISLHVDAIAMDGSYVS